VTKQIEILNSAGNTVIAQYCDRNFPGVLIQGDTLRILLDEIEELIDEAATGDLAATSGIANHIQKQLVDILSHYERVLKENMIELPYMNSVRN